MSIWLLRILIGMYLGRIAESCGTTCPANDETIRLWGTATGAHRQTLEGHGGWVSAATFSPDGKTLASALDDETIPQSCTNACPVEQHLLQMSVSKAPLLGKTLPSVYHYVPPVR